MLLETGQIGLMQKPSVREICGTNVARLRVMHVVLGLIKKLQNWEIRSQKISSYRMNTH